MSTNRLRSHIDEPSPGKALRPGRPRRCQAAARDADARALASGSKSEAQAHSSRDQTEANSL